MNRIRTIWAAVVNRWHAHPSHRLRDSGDRTDGHHGRCVQLLLLLHPNPDVELIRRVAFHDTTETGLGDVSGHAKRQNPELRAMLRRIESEKAMRLGLPEHLDHDPWLALVDMLDAWMWATTRGLDVASDDDWAEMAIDIMSLATSLGVYADVIGAMAGERTS